MTLMWQPTPERVAQTRLTRFIAAAESRCGISLPDYAALHRWSIEQREQFWTLLWDFCGVRAATRGEVALRDDRMPARSSSPTRA